MDYITLKKEEHFLLVQAFQFMLVWLLAKILVAEI